MIVAAAKGGLWGVNWPRVRTTATSAELAGMQELLLHIAGAYCGRHIHIHYPERVVRRSALRRCIHLRGK